jgi:hypothetical protein
MAILCRPLGSLVPKDFKIIWLSNLSIMSVPDYVNRETRLEDLFMNSETIRYLIFSGIRKGVYNLIEVISNEPNK